MTIFTFYQGARVKSGLAVLALGIGSPFALAHAAALQISLPAQPLIKSLNALSQQAGVQLIAAPDAVANKNAPALQGDMTLEAALARLLGGSGLGYSIENGTVVVAPQPAGADTLTVTGQSSPYSSVPQQTSSATKTDTPLLEVPQSVSVVTRERMDQQNVQSVTEALRYVPGVKTETYGVDPKGYDWIYIRGFNALTTNDYRDGLRQLNNSYSYFRTEPYALERIDIVRGPSSTLFGLGDAGGIVNRVSKLPSAQGVHDVELELGNFNRR